MRRRRGRSDVLADSTGAGADTRRHQQQPQPSLSLGMTRRRRASDVAQSEACHALPSDPSSELEVATRSTWTRWPCPPALHTMTKTLLAIANPRRCPSTPRRWARRCMKTPPLPFHLVPARRGVLFRKPSSPDRTWCRPHPGAAPVRRSGPADRGCRRIRFVNIRETGGWSRDAAQASPKIAALLAAARLPDPPPVPTAGPTARVACSSSARWTRSNRRRPWCRMCSM